MSDATGPEEFDELTDLDVDDLTIDEVERQIAAAMRGGDRLLERNLRLAAGDYHEHDGEPSRSIAHYRRLVDLCTDADGPDAFRTLEMRSILGRAMVEAHLYADAEVLLSDLLLDRERILGPDHPSTLITRGNLAKAIGRGGRLQEAIVVAERLLADRRRVLGPDDPATLDTIGHLSRFHSTAGDKELALELQRELHDARKRVLEPDDPVQAQTHHNLATMLAATQLPAEALTTLEDNVRFQRDWFGDDHPSVFAARAFVAQQLVSLGRIDDALAAYERLLADEVRVLGELSPMAMRSNLNVARCLHWLDRYEESLQRFDGLRRVLMAVHGPTAIDTLEARGYYMAELTWVERLAEAAVEAALLIEDLKVLDVDYYLRIALEDSARQILDAD